MATIEIEVKVWTYGMPVGQAVAKLFQWLGFDDRQCLAAAAACVFVRTRVGNKTSWLWLGRL